MVGMARRGSHVKVLKALFVDKRYINSLFNFNLIFRGYSPQCKGRSILICVSCPTLKILSIAVETYSYAMDFVLSHRKKDHSMGKKLVGLSLFAPFHVALTNVHVFEINFFFTFIELTN